MGDPRNPKPEACGWVRTLPWCVSLVRLVQSCASCYTGLFPDLASEEGPPSPLSRHSFRLPSSITGPALADVTTRSSCRPPRSRQKPLLCHPHHDNPPTFLGRRQAKDSTPLLPPCLSRPVDSAIGTTHDNNHATTTTPLNNHLQELNSTRWTLDQDPFLAVGKSSFMLFPFLSVSLPFGYISGPRTTTPQF